MSEPTKPSFEMKFIGKVTGYHHRKEHGRETSHMSLIHVGDSEYSPQLTAMVSIEGHADFQIDDIFELAIIPRESDKHAALGAACRCAQCRLDAEIAKIKAEPPR